MMASGVYQVQAVANRANCGRLRQGTEGGTKFKLINEGDVQICRLDHSSTLLSKILSSKFLRKWETHHVQLGDFQIQSTTVRKYLAHFFTNKPRGFYQNVFNESVLLSLMCSVRKSVNISKYVAQIKIVHRPAAFDKCGDFILYEWEARGVLSNILSMLCYHILLSVLDTNLRQ